MQHTRCESAKLKCGLARVKWRNEDVEKLRISLVLSSNLALHDDFSCQFRRAMSTVKRFMGWQVGPEGGNISESNGTLTFSGGDGSHIAPCLFKEFTPKGDFEISFQLKAETLGEVLVDQAGEGFVFSFGSINMTSLQFRVVSLWLRARAGGQFLLAWHDKLCDLYGWGCNWDSFRLQWHWIQQWILITGILTRLRTGQTLRSNQTFGIH